MTSRRYSILELAQAARSLDASDLHLVAGLAPAVRVNREIVLLKAEPLTRDRLTEMVLEILDDRRKAQLDATREACFSILDGSTGRLRVAIYFHAGCPEVSIRLCAREMQDSRTLGLPPILDELSRKPNGLILVAGPTGTGKTTTLNYLVDCVNRERRAKIVMIEDPVEYVHRPQKSIVVQQEVGTDTLSFSRALIHVLRQNPDVIAIGEMRELEAISTALTAAETGHLVMATLHTPNTAQTIERITGVYPAGQQEQVVLQLANCLQAVITQTLVPRADKQGVVLAYELLICTQAVRNLIRENQLHMIQNVIETGRKDGMLSLDACLQDLYKKGVITYDAAVSRAKSPERFTKRTTGSSVGAYAAD